MLKGECCLKYAPHIAHEKWVNFGENRATIYGDALCIAGEPIEPTEAVIRLPPAADGTLYLKGGLKMPRKSSDAMVSSRAILDSLDATSTPGE
jgi:hypothetical protein